MFKIDIWTFCQDCSVALVLIFVPNCIRNHYTKFEIGRTYNITRLLLTKGTIRNI